MTKLWLLALLLPVSTLNAQVVAPKADTARQSVGRKDLNKHAPESFMNGQIKHVSDFIDRFNHAAKAGNNGEAALRALFNEDDPRLPGRARAAHPYESQVTTFIQSVNARKTMIPKRGVIRAVTGLKVSYVGAPDTVIVHLRKDYTADSAAYWHITKVVAPARLAEQNVSARKAQEAEKRVVLPPNANEVSFLPLLRGLHDYQSLAPFTQCGECRDAAWLKVENALQNGRLTAEAVVSNRIYLTAGAWEIELSEFIREKENSGWLISDLLEKNATVK